MRALDILNQGGFRVRVTHFRYYLGKKNPLPKKAVTPFSVVDMEPYAKGGKTVCLILCADGHWAEDSVRCSDADQFNNWEGTALALEKTVKKFANLLPSGYQMTIERAMEALSAESAHRVIAREEKIADRAHNRRNADIDFKSLRERAAKRKAEGKPRPAAAIAAKKLKAESRAKK